MCASRGRSRREVVLVGRSLGREEVALRSSGDLALEANVGGLGINRQLPGLPRRGGQGACLRDKDLPVGTLAPRDLEIEARGFGAGEHPKRRGLANVAARPRHGELERDVGLGDQRWFGERDRIGERVDAHHGRVRLDARAGYEQPSPAVDVCDRRDVGDDVRRGRGGIEVAAPG